MIDSIVTLMDAAENNAWAFICIVMTFGAYKCIKYLGNVLFSEDGLLTRFIKDLQNDSKKMKEELAKTSKEFSDMHSTNIEHINGVELRLSNKIDEVNTNVKDLKK